MTQLLACVPDHGHVLKVLNTGRVDGHVDPMIVEDIPVFSSSSSSSSPVIGMKIVYTRYHGDRDSARLIVMSGGELRSLPLHRCGRMDSCSWVLILHFKHLFIYFLRFIILITSRWPALIGCFFSGSLPLHI